MKTSNIQQGRAHHEARIRGWVSPYRAGGSGVAVSDGSTDATGITGITVIGGTVIDNGDGTVTITFSGSGGRPPFDYVVAASDSATDLQAIADATCDGTADEVEINAAITAAVTADRPYSILLLPGTYTIGAAIDFTGWTALGGKWQVFEASGTTIIAGASMTTMVKLDPGSGGQIVTCADIRLGKLDGNAGSYTVSQIVKAARFSDNILRIEDIYNGTGDGISFTQAGVSDYPSGNNKIDIEIIRNCAGTGFYATGGTNAYGFQGNTVHVGEMIANGNGIVLGASANQNASYNTFIVGVIEHNTNAGVYDYCGGNTFIVGNMNTQTTNLGGPTGMTLKSTFRVHIDLATSGVIDAAVLDQHYVQVNGAQYGRALIKEKSATPTTPASGFGEFYFKSDSKPYALNDGGTEYDLSAGAALTGIDFLVGTATGALSGEIAVGTTPGGELGGTWASPTIDTTHSGSSHADAIATAEAYTDTAIAAIGGSHAHVASETHLSDGSTTTYTLDQVFEPGSVIAWNVTSLARLTVTEAAPDQATVSAAGSSGDSIVFDYAASIGS